MKFNEILNLAGKFDPSDLHISSNYPIFLRTKGKLIKLDTKPLTIDEVFSCISQIATPGQRLQLEQAGQVDFAFSEGGQRFRVNAFKELNGYSIAIRFVASKISDFSQLGIPDILEKLLLAPKGLVIITGPTGSGKSTTLSAAIEFLNRTAPLHIIKLEDPVEFVHQSQKCLIHQREICTHTNGFGEALRAALREDPDVIVIGELRDLDSIRQALIAAETGHLVLATLHTSSAIKTIDRIIDVFPAEEQNQIRVALSESLLAVFAQILCPSAKYTKQAHPKLQLEMSLEKDLRSPEQIPSQNPLDSITSRTQTLNNLGQVLACEVMLNNQAVKNLIREGKSYQIASVIQTSANLGMKTLEQSITELLHKKLIAVDFARELLQNPRLAIKAVPDINKSWEPLND